MPPSNAPTVLIADDEPLLTGLLEFRLSARKLPLDLGKHEENANRYPEEGNERKRGLQPKVSWHLRALSGMYDRGLYMRNFWRALTLLNTRKSGLDRLPKRPKQTEES